MDHDEQALRASEAELRALFELAGVGQALADPATGRYLRVNPKLCEITGYSRDELLGMTFSQLTHPDDRERDLALLHALVRGEVGTEAIEKRYVRKDGAIVWVQVTVTLLRDAQGRPLHSAAVIQDITDRKRAEQERADSEERYRDLFENANDVIYTLDLEGRITSVNRRAEQLLGYSRAEAVGRSSAELVPLEYHARMYDALRRKLGGESPTAYELELVRKDGRRVPVEVSSRLIVRGGVPVGIQGIARDVSERKRAEEALRRSEERFRLALESGVITAFEQDAELRYTWVYPQDPEFPPDNIGKSDEELVPGEEGRALTALKREVLATGRRARAEARVTLPGGVRYYDVLVEPRVDERGAVVGVVGAAFDVTDRRHAAEALHEADRRKNEFLATLAHELRNPLAPLRNGLGLLRLVGDDPSGREQALSMMDRQLRQMVRLIDDLLDVSRITRNRLELRREPVELDTVVRTAVEATRAFVESCGHELSVALPAEPVYLHADLTRLAQVLTNLLTNAAKYTNRGGHVRLSAAREAEQVVLSVRDDGIGIPADHLPRLFEMFSQAAPALERSQGGLGIGLALVRGLVEMHGGSVEARSEGPGRGSELVVRLPVLAGAPARPAPAGEDRPTARPACRALVVDDNRDNADSLALMLRQRGDEAQTAYDGLEALEAAGRSRPDVVLLDIGLPRMNGYEVARRLRAQPWGRQLVLIAITGWGQEEDRARAREAGFDHHLTKPVDFPDLERLLAAERRRWT
jgi:PAS domain S-box-containing protein